MSLAVSIANDPALPVSVIFDWIEGRPLPLVTENVDPDAGIVPRLASLALVTSTFAVEDSFSSEVPAPIFRQPCPQSTTRLYVQA